MTSTTPPVLTAANPSAGHHTHEPIHMARPQLGEAEQAAVAEVLASGALAQGRRVAAFEERFAERCGAAHAVAVNSGTAALHLALLAAGVGPGDEVITTPFTFIATVNAVLYTGATPVFADIDPFSFNLTAESVERAITPRTKAVVGVDLYGNMAGQPELAALARSRGLVFVEDACQAHGARVGNRSAGTLGDVAAFSFYPTKNMTTGEGGMITTSDRSIADHARLLRQHGAGKDRYLHEVVGFNLRMTEMAAAIGLVQLERLEQFNSLRRRNAAHLNEVLSGVAGLITPKRGEAGTHVYHQYTVRVTREARASRETLSASLAAANIGTSIFYPRLAFDQPAYAGRWRRAPETPVARELCQEALSLPVHPALTPADIERIGRGVRTICTGETGDVPTASSSAPLHAGVNGFRGQS